MAAAEGQAGVKKVDKGSTTVCEVLSSSVLELEGGAVLNAAEGGCGGVCLTEVVVIRGTSLSHVVASLNSIEAVAAAAASAMPMVPTTHVFAPSLIRVDCSGTYVDAGWTWSTAAHQLASSVTAVLRALPSAVLTLHVSESRWVWHNLGLPETHLATGRIKVVCE